MSHYTINTKTIEKIEECACFAERDLFYFVNDVLHLSEKILCIDLFEVEPHFQNQGLGTRVLSNYCAANKDKYVVFLIAGILNNADDLTEMEIQKNLVKLEKFYNAVGFENVNDEIGQYEDRCSFVYNGGVGSRVIQAIRKREEERLCHF